MEDTDLSDIIDELPCESENDYFIAHSTKSKINGKSFNELLKNSSFDLTEFQIKELVEGENKDEKNQLLNEYGKLYFKKWFELLNCGFNIIVHGVGSKKQLMENFRIEKLLSKHHIVIQGYFPELTVNHIIKCINIPIESDEIDETFVIEELKEIQFNFYIIINSIDKLFSSNVKIKSFFHKMITKCPKVHLIGTTDHINSGILFSSNELHEFKWVWSNCSTFENYFIERAFVDGKSKESTLSSALSNSLTLSSIQHVYDSLTINAQKIFLMILQFYINNESNDGAEFTFKDCYRQCREEFLVNSEMTLKAQLSEFKDHKLIKMKKSSDGADMIKLCFDLELSKRFYEKHENQF